MFKRPFRDTPAMEANWVLFGILWCRSKEGLSIAPELDIHEPLELDSYNRLGFMSEAHSTPNTSIWEEIRKIILVSNKGRIRRLYLQEGEECFPTLRVRRRADTLGRK